MQAARPRAFIPQMWKASVVLPDFQMLSEHVSTALPKMYSHSRIFQVIRREAGKSQVIRREAGKSRVIRREAGKQYKIRIISCESADCHHRHPLLFQRATKLLKKVQYMLLHEEPRSWKCLSRIHLRFRDSWHEYRFPMADHESLIESNTKMDRMFNPKLVGRVCR
jgi:hypothetical protein